MKRSKETSIKRKTGSNRQSELPSQISFLEEMMQSLK